MPYADNQGLRVHYVLEGDGPPLVLQHGFTQSLKNWYEYGYVEVLKSDYQLILIDARGHGGSDKPHDPAEYTLDRRVSFKAKYPGFDRVMVSQPVDTPESVILEQMEWFARDVMPVFAASEELAPAD